MNSATKKSCLEKGVLHYLLWFEIFLTLFTAFTLCRQTSQSINLPFAGPWKSLLGSSVTELIAQIPIARWMSSSLYSWSWSWSRLWRCWGWWLWQCWWQNLSQETSPPQEADNLLRLNLRQKMYKRLILVMLERTKMRLRFQTNVHGMNFYGWC